MALSKRGKYYYGDAQSDIRPELIRFSEKNAYPVDHFADATCKCGSILFELATDDDNGVAVRTCKECGNEHIMGDGAGYIDVAEPEVRECVCEGSTFEITSGIHLYRTTANELSNDVKWLYIGCRCPACGLLGCYSDWKNEFEGYASFLASL